VSPFSAGRVGCLPAPGHVTCACTAAGPWPDPTGAHDSQTPMEQAMTTATPPRHRALAHLVRSRLGTLRQVAMAAALGLAALVAGVAQADASPITDIRVAIDETRPTSSGLGAYALFIDHKNNTPGAEYNSAELNDVLNDIASQIAANNPNVTVSEIIDGYRTSATVLSGEVDNGWSAVVGANGDIIYNHIDGRPNRDYDQWKNTSADPSNDTLQFFVSGDLSQLDANGDGVYSFEDGDLRLIDLQEYTSNPLFQQHFDMPLYEDGFVGSEGVGGGLSFYGDVTGVYVADPASIPEPGTMVLLATGLAGGLAGYRNRKRMRQD